MVIARMGIVHVHLCMFHYAKPSDVQCIEQVDNTTAALMCELTTLALAHEITKVALL